MNSKFNDWKYSIEIDYLSLYIKTWFAFLDTLKNLYPDIQSQTGDGNLIKEYAENFDFSNCFDDEWIKENIRKIQENSKNCFTKYLPNYYYKIFYITNNHFRFHHSATEDLREKRKRTTSKIKIQFATKLNDEKKNNIYISLKNNHSHFLKYTKKHLYEINLILDDFLYKKENFDFFKSKDSFIDLIMKNLNDSLDKEIKESSKRDKRINPEKRKKLLDKMFTALFQEVRSNFKLDELFKPQSNYLDLNDTNTRLRKDDLKWFVNFNYSLRNILFHSVINPFKPEWLIVFKHAYLILIELVEHNIKTIESKKH